MAAPTQNNMKSCTFDESNNKYDAKECQICLENFKTDSKVYSLGCFHIFHKECLDQVEDSKCPLCRKPIEGKVKLQNYSDFSFIDLLALPILLASSRPSRCDCFFHRALSYFREHDLAENKRYVLRLDPHERLALRELFLNSSKATDETRRLYIPIDNAMRYSG